MVSCSIPAGRPAVCLGYDRVNESSSDYIVSAIQFSDRTAVIRDILIRPSSFRRPSKLTVDSLRNNVPAALMHEIHVSSIILPRLVTRDSLPSHNVALHFNVAIAAGYTKVKKFDT